MPTQKSQGFTITELLITLVIIGIVAINASPKSYNRSVVNESVFLQEVLAGLRYGQKLAINSGCHVQASFQSNSFTLLARQNCTTGNFNINVVDPGSNNMGFVKSVITSVSLSTNQSTFYFDALGLAHLSSDGSIGNINIKVNNLNINIVGQTGLVYAA